MKLWRVTFITPLGRRTSHHPYAVIAATAQEAKTKAVAYVYHNPVQTPTYTIEVEEDTDGVMGGTHFYRDTVKGAK